MKSETSGVVQKDLATVKQLSQRFPAFSEGGVRWLIFNEKQNGLSKAVVRIGRRVLIDVPAFFQWVQDKQER